MSRARETDDYNSYNITLDASGDLVLCPSLGRCTFYLDVRTVPTAGVTLFMVDGHKGISIRRFPCPNGHVRNNVSAGARKNSYISIT
jgi:hypothetical protein